MRRRTLLLPYLVACALLITFAACKGGSATNESPPVDVQGDQTTADLTAPDATSGDAIGDSTDGVTGTDATDDDGSSGDTTSGDDGSTSDAFDDVTLDDVTLDDASDATGADGSTSDALDDVALGDGNDASDDDGSGADAPPADALVDATPMDTSGSSCGSSSLDVPETSGPIGTAGGTLSSGGVTLEVPDGALGEEKTFTIRKVSDDVCPPNVIRVGPTVEITAGELHTLFQKLAKVTLPYEEGLVPNGRNETEIHVFYAASPAGPWHILPTNVDAPNDLVGIEVPHLTYFMPGLTATPLASTLPIPVNGIYADSLNLGGGVVFVPQTAGIAQNGVLLAKGFLQGGSVTTANDDVLVSTRSGAPMLIAREGDPIPADPDGRIYGAFWEYVTTSSDQIVLATSTTGGFSYIMRGEPLQIYLRTLTTPAPTTEVRTFYSPSELRLSEGGTLAFRSQLRPSAGLCSAAPCDGIFVETPSESLSAWLLDGRDKLPSDLYAFDVFFSASVHLSLSPTDQLGFDVALENASGGSVSPDRDLVFGAPGAFEAVLSNKVYDGLPYLGLDVSAFVGVDRFGTVVVIGDDTGLASEDFTLWIWDKTNGPRQLIKVGDTVGGGTVTALLTGSEARNPVIVNGRVLFGAIVDGNEALILRESDGTLKLLAQVGSLAPSFAANGPLLAQIHAYRLNAKGQVVFDGSLSTSSPGVTTANNKCIFAFSADGTAHLMARLGEKLVVQEGVERAITAVSSPLGGDPSGIGGEQGGNNAFTDNGELVVKLGVLNRNVIVVLRVP
ncbi:MAG: hypothetical protein KC609_20320 [Myxococcales bacterium]|nr:hypothetical protein [Myxococcales bacterium]